MKKKERKINLETKKKEKQKHPTISSLYMDMERAAVSCSAQQWHGGGRRVDWQARVGLHITLDCF